MKRLSTRERLYLGIFVVALIWGAWNYRHLLFKPSPPEMAKVVNTSDAATPAPHVRVVPATAVADFDSPKWDDDPFHRGWRGGTRRSTSDGRLSRSPTDPVSPHPPSATGLNGATDCSGVCPQITSTSRMTKVHPGAEWLLLT